MAILSLTDGTFLEGFVLNKANSGSHEVAVLFDNFSRLLKVRSDRNA